MEDYIHNYLFHNSENLFEQLHSTFIVLHFQTFILICGTEIICINQEERLSTKDMITLKLKVIFTQNDLTSR